MTNARSFLTTALVALAIAIATPVRAQQPLQAEQVPEKVKVPVFGTVTVYRPSGAPQQVALFLSGDGGWNLGVVSMAERLRDAGALVIGIDVREFMGTMESSSKCAYPAGALEELSRAMQQRYKLASYMRPILVGYSSGATLAYAAIAAAPPETFAGAISLGFCPDLEMPQPLCEMRGLVTTKRTMDVGFNLAPNAKSTVPWMVLQGDVDQVCRADATTRFVASTGAATLYSLPKVGHGYGVPARWAPQFLDAYHAVASAHATKTAAVPKAAAPEVADLSLVEVRPQGQSIGSTMAIVMTGDGGWADIDKSIASGLAAAGIPVVGWSSLDYYWNARTPEGAAHDLERIIEHYTRAWHADKVLVVGYSFGADVAPFLVNRLPASVRQSVSTVALLSPSDNAAFAFHISDWFGGGSAPPNPTIPEIARLEMPVRCVAAEDESDSVCRKVGAPGVRPVAIGHGHHFSGEYDRIVSAILR